jgi:hypothetical protein
MLLRGSSSELLVVFLVASCWRTGGGPLTPRARTVVRTGDHLVLFGLALVFCFCF